MANSNRRVIDTKGRMFLPMNLSTYSWSDKVLTPARIIGMIVIAIAYISGIYMIHKKSLKGLLAFLLIALITFISQFIVRYVILNEKYYYRMYKEMESKHIESASKFWNIPYVNETDQGALLMYRDAKMGVIVKLERDVITGKESDFKERHYDALSDCYKSLIGNGLRVMHMSWMEEVGKDKRLDYLDRFTNQTDNPNINRLCEVQINHMKERANNTLYDEDYYCIYTADLRESDKSFLDKVTDGLEILFDGGYKGFTILGTNELKEINEFAEEYFHVALFDFSSAKMEVFSNTDTEMSKHIRMSGIVWSNGELQRLSMREINTIMNETSEVINKGRDSMNKSLKEALYSRKEKENFGVDIEELESLANDIGNEKMEPRDSDIVDF